jgi:hypothetical protein
VLLAGSSIRQKHFDLVGQIAVALTEDTVPDQLLSRLVDKGFDERERRLAVGVAIFRSPSPTYLYDFHLLWAD